MPDTLKTESVLLDPRVLGNREIVTSTDLVQRLVKRGYAAGTARQLLRRGYEAAGLWRSDSLVLPTGARLFARKPYFGDSSFLRELRPILHKHRPGIGRVLDAMMRWEAIDLDTLKKLTAVKLDSAASGEKHAQELAAIVEVGIGLWEDKMGRPRLVRRQFFQTPKSESLGLELDALREIERNMARIVIKHYRLQHIVAWQTPDTLRDGPYNGQLFSAVGYSHLRPLVKFQQQKRSACPVVFEVLGRAAEEFDVDGLMARIYRAGDHKGSKLRILGVICAPTFSPAAFKAASLAGLCVVNFGQVFGRSALDALAAIQAVKSEALSSKPLGSGAQERLASRLATTLGALKSNPLVSDLCGMGLETYAVACLRSQGFEDVVSNRKVPFQKNGAQTERDVDASGKQDRVWRVIECKAFNENVELREEDVKYFFCETLPAMLRHIGKNNIEQCDAELWTTGKVTPAVATYLSGLKLDKRVRAKIRSRREIPAPSAIKSLSRILAVIEKI